MLDAYGQPQSMVVLGGTSEIAGAVVRRLAGRRCRRLVLAGRDAGRLAAAAEDARRAGAEQVDTVVFDARDAADAGRVVDRCFAAGDADMVLVAVGLLPEDGVATDPGCSAEVAVVTYAWPAAAMSAAAAHLVRQGHGRIVVLSSAGAIRVRRSNFVYGSAKAGLDAFARGLSEALSGTGVTVQVVRPGFVHTKMTAGRRPTPLSSGPDTVADRVVAGLASGDPVVWSPAALRWVSLALRVMPGPLWRRHPA